MTTEKEFWDFAGRYFRTLTSIQTVIDELQEDSALPKDLRAIKSMKKIENIMNDFNKQKPEDLSIDEECVGCCKVVDVAAKLQKELDASRGLVASYKKGLENRDEIIRKTNAFIEQQKTTINELKDQNIEDLKELYDLDKEDLDRLKHVISARDLTIKSLTTMCQSSGTERNKLASTIEELNSQLTEKKEIIDKITRLRVDEVETRQGLEAELSARKQDSAVLMKVVEIIRDDTIPNSKVPCMICNLVDAYLDAPEGPPETPKEDPQEIIITCAWLELP